MNKNKKEQNTIDIVLTLIVVAMILAGFWLVEFGCKRVPKGNGESIEDIRKDVGIMMNSRSYKDIGILWRGYPGDKTAFNFVHNGYGGTIDRTKKILETCFLETKGQMKVLVRPYTGVNDYDYVTEILKSPYADLIIGWYVADESFSFPWGLDQVPEIGQTKCEYWFDYRSKHGGKSPWSANVNPYATIEDLTTKEKNSIRQKGGDDIYYILKRIDQIKKAESDLKGNMDCQNGLVRRGKHLPIYADYAALIPMYGWFSSRVSIVEDKTNRIGFWWKGKWVNSVEHNDRTITRGFGAFNEDVVIVNWFGSPFKPNGELKVLNHNRIDGALALIRGQTDKPLYFFLGYGQGLKATAKNIELTVDKDEVSGYCIWSWDMVYSIKEDWISINDDDWAGLIEGIQ